ncbi:MAG: LPS export ABC transporter periplasmic protein LptC [Candidatus Eisenbacteria bacterium]|uniref:LPS export ABC transporter periplasmic protein LptC n=1 Tax=Eiseniibacteriota bacterium TaxID=2212470 RepID=A0A849SEI4_UNCEI|nr:LPS export ABC transporter periplasmic protein LptC [Candidatus Eisenbacteria bacterium]
MPRQDRPFQARAPRFPWFGIACLAVLGLTLLAGCGHERTARTGAASAELPDQEVSDFSVDETDAGAIQWKLYAQSAAIYNARALIAGRVVRVDFFGRDGKRTSTLTADEGELHQVAHDMIARGHVVMQTTEGTRMTTEELRFDNDSQKIFSDRFVRIERRGNVLTGYGFESDPNLEHYEFKREVKAVVRTQSGGGISEGPR